MTGPLRNLPQVSAKAASAMAVLVTSGGGVPLRVTVPTMSAAEETRNPAASRESPATSEFSFIDTDTKVRLRRTLKLPAVQERCKQFVKNFTIFIFVYFRRDAANF